EDQCVAQQTPEVKRVEEPLEVFKACPVAPPDALGRDEVLEGDLRSVHRDVVEDQEEDQCRCGQQVQLPVAAQAAAQTAPTGRTDRRRPARGLFRKGSRHLKPGPCGHALLPWVRRNAALRNNGGSATVGGSRATPASVIGMPISGRDIPANGRIWRIPWAMHTV